MYSCGVRLFVKRLNVVFMPLLASRSRIIFPPFPSLSTPATQAMLVVNVDVSGDGNGFHNSGGNGDGGGDGDSVMDIGLFFVKGKKKCVLLESSLS